MYYFIFYLRVIRHQTVLTNIYSVLKAKEVCYFLFRAFTKPHPSLQLQILFSFFPEVGTWRTIYDTESNPPYTIRFIKSFYKINKVLNK